jgi:hypothetical protein
MEMSHIDIPQRGGIGFGISRYLSTGFVHSIAFQEVHRSGSCHALPDQPFPCTSSWRKPNESPNWKRFLAAERFYAGARKQKDVRVVAGDSCSTHWSCSDTGSARLFQHHCRPRQLIHSCPGDQRCRLDRGGLPGRTESLPWLPIFS